LRLPTREINYTISEYNLEVDRLTNEEAHPTLEKYRPEWRVEAMRVARAKMLPVVDIVRLKFLGE
jgi:hypothetical protein